MRYQTSYRNTAGFKWRTEALWFLLSIVLALLTWAGLMLLLNNYVAASNQPPVFNIHYDNTLYAFPPVVALILLFIFFIMTNLIMMMVKVCWSGQLLMKVFAIVLLAGLLGIEIYNYFSIIRPFRMMNNNFSGFSASGFFADMQFQKAAINIFFAGIILLTIIRTVLLFIPNKSIES